MSQDTVNANRQSGIETNNPTQNVERTRITERADIDSIEQREATTEINMPQQEIAQSSTSSQEHPYNSSTVLVRNNSNNGMFQNFQHVEDNGQQGQLLACETHERVFLELVSRVAGNANGPVSITFAPNYQRNYNNRYYADQREFHHVDVANSSDLNFGSGNKVCNVHDQGLPMTGSEQKQSNSEGRSSSIAIADTDFRKKDEDNAIKKVLELQEKYREDDIQLQGIDVVGSDIPEVHPTYMKISFYQGEAAPKTEEYLPSTATLSIREELQVDFEDLLQSENQPHFVCLIGIPGSGKSTCASRLAKSKDFACFSMNFMDMTYPDPLTLKDLLLRKAYPDLEKKVCDEAFRWIVHNQKQCAFIFDGIDQAEWTLKEKVPRQDYDTPLPVADLVSNLCNKRFLPDAHLVFTSRPHSVIFLPKSCRPDATYLLGDLTYDCTKELFYSYAGDQAGSMWEALESHAPHLISLCSNPLMIQLVVASCLNPSSKFGNILSLSCKSFTQTRVFATVLDNLKRCNNTRHKNIEELSAQIGRVAFQATKNSTVIITTDQLRKEGLSTEKVQDIIITFHSRKGITSKVFEGDTKMIFCHQTFQEYYTGYHVTHSMSIQDFLALVKGQLFTYRWAMVRRFVCGQLVDLTSGFQEEKSCTSIRNDTAYKRKSTGELKAVGDLIHEKRQILVDSIIQKMKEFSAKFEGDADSKRRLLDLWCDVHECNDEYLRKKAAEYTPVNVKLWATPLNAHQVFSCCYILSLAENIQVLNLSSCHLTRTYFRQFCDAIKHMKSIKMFSFVGNYLESNAVHDICEILPYITHELGMGWCFASTFGMRSANEDEMSLIQESLNKLDDSNLQVLVNIGVILRTKKTKIPSLS
ncbi:unnamed protein product [Clavelina lepadiformis]|uniref:NACHT domain-containing protein n=1 Tax=Clavelina lepadiformis TaxID=159417 RepID=A0ABP0G020_CLALP